MLFATDDELRHSQRQAAKRPKDAPPLSDEEQRLEAIADARELREHQRMRQFAWLLFIAPVLLALLYWFIGFAIRAVTASP